jgi:signal transduction histidine kinase
MNGHVGNGWRHHPSDTAGTAGLTRSRERLALIARVGQIITSRLELDGLLQAAADAIHEMLRYPNVDIPLLDPLDPKTLVVAVRGGHYKRLIRQVDRLPLSRGVMGAAVRQKRPQLVNDVARDRRYVSPPGVTGIRAELAVPIRLGQEILGVLNVESERPFDDEDVSSLQWIAGYLAAAVRNARLHESAQRRAAREERHRLARDLHDSVVQQLFSASLLARSLAASAAPRALGRPLQRVMDLTGNALAEMRLLMADLSSAESADASSAGAGADRVRESGLPAALERYAADLSGQRLRIVVQAGEYQRQPLETERALYRIAQEAINNVVKHARARTVRLTLDSRSVLRLEVRDDGIGGGGRAAGGRSTANRRTGHGLISMRSRAESLGGRLWVHSRHGRGTTVKVTLPLPDLTRARSYAS